MVAVVVLIMTVLAVVASVVMVVFVVSILVMVVFVMVVFREGHVVRCIVAVEFLSIIGVFRKDVDVGRARAVERSAEFADQHRFVVKGGLAAGHGVGARNERTFGHGDGINPSIQSESVVKEHISLGQTNQLFGCWLVVVNGDVHGVDHFNFNQVPGNG